MLTESFSRRQHYHYGLITFTVFFIFIFFFCYLFCCCCCWCCFSQFSPQIIFLFLEYHKGELWHWNYFVSVNTQMCVNPALAIHSGDMPPPLYICNDCAEYLRHDQGEYMVDLLLPMPHVSTTCENKVGSSIFNLVRRSVYVSLCVLCHCACISELDSLHEWMKTYLWRLTISTQNNVCSHSHKLKIQRH